MSKTDFGAGDLVLVKEVDPSTLKEGDIIAYTSQNTSNYGETVTHKIRKLTTDANGEPCPIYGFLITHKEMGRMLYITDCELIKWKFRDINHILLGVNYDKDLIDRDNTGKANHVFRGHLSIDTACDFVKANYSDSLQNVIMCHLSSENADRDSFIEKMKKVACGANVDVAEPNKEWLLSNPNECPF